MSLARLTEIQNGSILETSLCIIGGGGAGLAIAAQALEKGLPFILVESGGLDPSAGTQDLADGENVHRPHEGLRSTRDRALGGSMHSWAGACAPLDETDFVARPWFGEHDIGWPYGSDALEPYYQRAHDMLHLGDVDYDPDHVTDDNRFLDLGLSSIEPRLWRFSPRVNFGKSMQQVLQNDTRSTVLLEATATDIIATENRKAVTGVTVQHPSGASATVQAKRVVLAASAIDNARLLLLSDLGNQHDQVGRYFAQHPHVSAASMTFPASKRWMKSYKDFKHDGVWMRARLGLKPEARHRFGVGNAVATIINRQITNDLAHAQSIGYVALKRILLDLARRRVPVNMRERLASVLGDLPGLARGTINHIRNQNGGLHVMAEQAPNPDSRVTLSTSHKDCFDQPVARCDWRLQPIDKITVRTLVKQLSQELGQRRLADVTPDEWLIADDGSWPDSLAGGHHFMGTTRMSEDPAKGVVDPNAKVHGIDNLYIAGASIFPSQGCANPTLSVITTSLLLADHLLTDRKL